MRNMPFYSLTFGPINLVRCAERNMARIFFYCMTFTILYQKWNDYFFFMPLRVMMGFWSVTSRQHVFALFPSPF